jgi:2-polyprenyl-6-methoxyphenol hydroxylase-like FAD-dependent oxidoreductase
MDDIPALAPKRHIHILIIGAGLTGLILAQSINKFNASPAAADHPVRYTYAIFERESGPLSRGGGFSLTFHWSLAHLEDALAPDILAGIKDCLCNPHGVETGQVGRFQYLNLRTAEAKISVAPMQKLRIARVSREKLIRLLLRGVDVQYSRQLLDVSFPTKNELAEGVRAHFADGSSATGSLLVGSDGGNSAVRRLVLCPGPAGENKVLPVRQVALRASYPVDRCRIEFQRIDPNVIMGGDPETNTFFWFSFIDIPRPGSDAQSADCYITMSWPCEDEHGNKLDEAASPLVPPTSPQRLALIKRMAAGWAEPMRAIIQDLPDGTHIREINILQWLPEKGSWNTHGGRVTIAGDAAHPMSSCKFRLIVCSILIP